MATDPIHNPLPGGVFRDESTYAEECERLVSGRWLSVTTGLVVPEPGDLFPCRLFGRSLLVARGKDGEVRVFYNLCRHRGAPLVDQPCRAVAGLVTCPYHAWSYRIDGSLFRAPYYHREREKTSPSEDERENLGLIPLRTAVWRDIIFVDFDGTAPEFDGFIAPIDNRLADWSAAELHPLGSREYIIGANWKLVAENFLDAYHLPVVHPELGGWDFAKDIEDLDLGKDLFGFLMPHGYGEDNAVEYRDTPTFSSLPESRKLAIEVFCIFPNTLILVEPDSQQVITLRPEGPGITGETFADYSAGPLDNEAERADWLAFSQNVNDQDQVLLEKLQLTRSMPVADQTRMVPDWDQACARFQQAWRDAMA